MGAAAGDLEGDADADGVGLGVPVGVGTGDGVALVADDGVGIGDGVGNGVGVGMSLGDCPPLLGSGSTCGAPGGNPFPAGPPAPPKRRPAIPPIRKPAKMTMMASGNQGMPRD